MYGLHVMHGFSHLIAKVRHCGADEFLGAHVLAGRLTGWWSIWSGKSVMRITAQIGRHEGCIGQNSHCDCFHTLGIVSCESPCVVTTPVEFRLLGRLHDIEERAFRLPVVPNQQDLLRRISFGQQLLCVATDSSEAIGSDVVRL